MTDTVTLDDDQARFVDALVHSGRFADRRAVLQAGLNALRDRDEALEHWLREDAVPVATKMMADHTGAVPAEEVFDDIERRHATRAAAALRGT